MKLPAVIGVGVVCFASGILAMRGIEKFGLGASGLIDGDDSRQNSGLHGGEDGFRSGKSGVRSGGAAGGVPGVAQLMEALDVWDAGGRCSDWMNCWWERMLKCW